MSTTASTSTSTITTTNNNNTTADTTNNNNNNNQQQDNTSSIDSSYKRQSDGPVLWFSGPPVNVTMKDRPMHSLSYLEWKKNKKFI
ncbi:hypothetical protein RMCBS344292_01034 [Rhizopus microsporus]|nr:hypothetical protein RMCBS344292_01034 [Rhizopus microsporus]